MKLQYQGQDDGCNIKTSFLMTVSSLTFQIITAIIKECTSKIMLSKYGLLISTFGSRIARLLALTFGALWGRFLGCWYWCFGLQVKSWWRTYKRTQDYQTGRNWMSGLAIRENGRRFFIISMIRISSFNSYTGNWQKLLEIN